MASSLRVWTSFLPSTYFDRLKRRRYPTVGRQDLRPRACGRLSGRPSMAASRRWFGYGLEEERKRFVAMVEKACRIARQLRDIGIRKSGVVRIDSASRVHDWARNPAESQKQIARTFARACDVAEQFGERLAAEGEICWGGMHSWRNMVELLEGVGRPKTLASKPTWPTRCCRPKNNAPEHRLLPKDHDWAEFKQKLDEPQPKRSRTRSGPGRSISTSPRTMELSKARKARTTRRDVTAWSATRMANWILRAMPATG